MNRKSFIIKSNQYLQENIWDFTSISFICSLDIASWKVIDISMNSLKKWQTYEKAFCIVVIFPVLRSILCRHKFLAMNISWTRKMHKTNFPSKDWKNKSVFKATFLFKLVNLVEDLPFKPHYSKQLNIIHTFRTCIYDCLL